MYKRGTVVLIPFPFTDLSSQKVRPALIISKSNPSDDITVIFISSIIKKIPQPHQVLISQNQRKFNETGLKTDSLINTGKIATLSKKICLGELGKLSESMMKKVNVGLRSYLSL